MSTGRDHCICLIFCYKFIPRFFICVILLWLFSALYFHTKLQMMPEHDICSLWQLVNKLWCENFTGYESGKGSGLRQPFWCSSASMDWLQNICPSTASWRPAIHICVPAVCSAHADNLRRQEFCCQWTTRVEQFTCGTAFKWRHGGDFQKTSEDISV